MPVTVRTAANAVTCCQDGADHNRMKTMPQASMINRNRPVTVKWITRSSSAQSSVILVNREPLRMWLKNKYGQRNMALVNLVKNQLLAFSPIRMEMAPQPMFRRPGRKETHQMRLTQINKVIKTHLGPARTLHRFPGSNLSDE